VIRRHPLRQAQLIGLEKHHQWLGHFNN